MPSCTAPSAHRPRRRPLGVAALLLLIGLPGARADEQGAEDLAFFERKIRPVLVEQCYRCHSAEAEAKGKLRGGLRLDTRAGLLQGGDGGPIVVPGKADESPLVAALRYDDTVQMPPKGKLPDAVIADFEAWVGMGAPDPRSEEPTPSRRGGIDVEAGRSHWAYRPPRPSPPPDVKDTAWPLGAIDRFVLARLEAAGLRPGPDADRATLARRLAFDLTGLPPTPGEVDAFVNDPAADAYERLVDRLLASPHFGERWGRHWLDLARFAESVTLRGLVLKDAWRYRDFVIESFNADRPYDQFLREQIAGDLLPADSLADRRRGRVATAFLVLGNTNLEEQDKAQLRMDVVDEQIDVIGKAVLAQTIACARCHDHKFDPIPTRDYYALAGILRNVKTMEHANVSKWLDVPLPVVPEQEAALRAHEEKVAALEARIKAARSQKSTDPGKAGLPALEAELKRLKATGPRRETVISVLEEKEIGDTRVHVRGSVHTLGAPVPRGFLQVATSGPVPPLPSHESGRRELAAWLTSRDNPLTARVLVNRAWHWLTGAGLVRTVDNFGTTGEAPSHPELLDALAVRFMEDGWSVKALVRRIVLSRTYRLATADDPRARAVDPENRLRWRAERRRLYAECLRDAILAASGRLRLDMGGPSFPADLAADYGFTYTGTRRSVYAPVFRNALPELFEVFDFADPSLVVGRRDASTVAPQALFLMNSPFVREHARHAARRLLAGPEPDDRNRLDRAYRVVLGRLPTEAERRVALEFVGGGASADPETTWAAVVQALFASPDFRDLN